MKDRVYVCDKCIEDSALQQVVRDNAVSKQCDYCNRKAKKPIACELSDVIERIRSAIDQEYDRPENELPYDEGEYVGTVFYGAEIFDEIAFGVDNATLMDDICSEFWDDAFCKRDYFGPDPDDIFGSAWGRFSDIVKHQRRYTFWNSVEEGEFREPGYGITPTKLLSMIAGNIEYLSPVISIPVETKLWRIRDFPIDDPKIKDPKEYTSPPIDKATQANRLSPAGISMFYGADTLDTAYAETIDPDKMKGRVASGAAFTPVIPLTLLDLTEIPSPASFFEEEWDRERRQSSAFLQAFADTLSEPIKKDNRYHIEYVPTQVFTEYIRYELKGEESEPFQGVKYKSSRKKGGICYAIFADQDKCLPNLKDRKTPQLLQFVPRSIRMVPAK